MYGVTGGQKPASCPLKVLVRELRGEKSQVSPRVTGDARVLFKNSPSESLQLNLWALRGPETTSVFYRDEKRLAKLLSGLSHGHPAGTLRLWLCKPTCSAPLCDLCGCVRLAPPGARRGAGELAMSSPCSPVGMKGNLGVSVALESDLVWVQILSLPSLHRQPCHFPVPSSIARAAGCGDCNLDEGCLQGRSSEDTVPHGGRNMTWQREP